MALVLAGINHNTATIDLREKVAFPPEIVARAIDQLRKLEGVEEVVIVSTCNRTELYLAVDLVGDPGAPDLRSSEELTRDTDLEAIQQQVTQWLGHFHQLEAGEIRNCSYFYWQEQVVRHLMKVCSGLDSMVLGEPQILGQIKSAYAVSRELDIVGVNLGRAFQDAFSVAKEVRTDTAIGENPVSVAYSAVTLAERIFSNLPSLSALLIGAGRTMELVARHLQEKGLTRIVVANRTLERAVELGSRFAGHGVLLSDIPEQLVNADIVVSSTNSQLPLLGKGAVEKAFRQRRHRPMLLVDLAVPRDIEPEVGEVPDAYLYTIDDIRGVIDDSVRSRTEAANEAELIIERGVSDYQRQVRSLGAVSTLKTFRSRADRIRSAELNKALRALEKGDSAEKVLELLSRGITNKLIHAPTVKMKHASAEGRDELLMLVRELYDLDDQEADRS
ncbi:MAG: glutamyl-tRNA reductase [Gammaproteobacteria bacterium]|jgi:glutamyl-tRNA reductase